MIDGAIGKVPRENITAIAKIAGKHFGMVNTIDFLQVNLADLISALGDFRRTNFANRIEVTHHLGLLQARLAILQHLIDPKGTEIEASIQQELRELKKEIREERSEIDGVKPRLVGEGVFEEPVFKGC